MFNNKHACPKKASTNKNKFKHYQTTVIFYYINEHRVIVVSLTYSLHKIC